MDRRRSAWANPSTWFGLASLLLSFAGLCLSFIMACGVLVGIYVASAVQTAKIEVVNTNLINKTNELSAKIENISTSGTEQKGKIEFQDRRIEDLEDRRAEIEKMIEANEKAQRDYNFKLGNDLAEIKTMLGMKEKK